MKISQGVGNPQINLNCSYFLVKFYGRTFPEEFKDANHGFILRARPN